MSSTLPPSASPSTSPSPSPSPSSSSLYSPHGSSDNVSPGGFGSSSAFAPPPPGAWSHTQPDAAWHLPPVDRAYANAHASPALTERLAQFHTLKQQGVHFNAHLYGRRDACNPTMYASLVHLLRLDQHGSLFSPPPHPTATLDRDRAAGGPLEKDGHLLCPRGWSAHDPERRKEVDCKRLSRYAQQLEEARSGRRLARRHEGPFGARIEFTSARLGDAPGSDADYAVRPDRESNVEPRQPTAGGHRSSSLSSRSSRPSQRPSRSTHPHRKRHGHERPHWQEHGARRRSQSP